jgi:antitoxin VapB
MAFHIRNSKVEEDLRQLCQITGESLTEAVHKAVLLRLEQERASTRSGVDREQFLRERYRKMRERLSKLPILDTRSPDEILGYDENGMPS